MKRKTSTTKPSDKVDRVPAIGDIIREAKSLVRRGACKRDIIRHIEKTVTDPEHRLQIAKALDQRD